MTKTPDHRTLKNSVTLPLSLVGWSETPEAFWDGDFRTTKPEEVRISPWDRSFHFGDSVYEVIRTYKGIPFALEDHLSRMETSLRWAQFQVFPPKHLILELIEKTVREFLKISPKTDLYIRWMISRGWSDWNINPRQSSLPYAFVFVKALHAPTLQDWNKGLHYWLVDQRRNPVSALPPQMKSGNYLNNVLGLEQALSHGADDAFMLNPEGLLTEGTTNNVFLVKGGTVFSPPVQNGLLAGITRNRLFAIMRKNEIPCQEKPLAETDLMAADEIFITSTIKEVMPVTRLNGSAVSEGEPGPLTSRLFELWKQHVDLDLKKGSYESYWTP